MTILPLVAAADPQALEALLDAAFGADRHRRTAYRLREGQAAIPALSFAACEEGALVGSLQSWRIELAHAGGTAPLLLVGPIAVSPDRQRGGIGRRLTSHALAAIDAAGETASVLIGDPEYYARFFGYDAAPTRHWRLPGAVERHRLLARLTGGRTLPAEGELRGVTDPVHLAARTG